MQNIPFYLPKFSLSGIGYKGWGYAADPTGRLQHGFHISPSNLEDIVLKRGIGPKGDLSGSWWMFAKVGTRYSLKWVEEDDNNKKG